MTTKRDYYEVLGVSRDAKEDEIKKAFRKKAMEHHPDRNNGDKDSERLFKECAEAYDVLGDEEKRSTYDQFGHAAFQQGGGPRGFGGQRFDNVEDIFRAFGDIFGGGGGAGGGIFGEMFGGRRARPGERTGRSLKIVLDLTLEEIDAGVERTVALKRQEHCPTCNGSGAKKGTTRSTCTGCGGRGQVHRSQGFFTMSAPCPRCQGQGSVLQDPCPKCRGNGQETVHKEIKIHVPAGIEEGVQLRVTGEGDAGDPGAPRGDLYCVVREVEHKIFQRSGADVITEIPVAFAQMALGDEVEVPTLRGRAKMTIPSSTQSGKVFRLRGQGLPTMDGGGRGDQLVRVFIEVPTKLSSRQKELLKEFNEIEQKNAGERSFFDRILKYFNQ
ncbi:MAG: molecular chaperone DnaJ [Planctomycetes bacterium]|jgi:molecular chaperone DnaJ|nr:molecular chaperone DnaJ [Planctomycetota bacterium]